MAKRATQIEPVYSPLDVLLARSVANKHSPQQALPEVVHPPNSPPHGECQGIQGPRSLRDSAKQKRVLMTLENERRIERLVDHLGERLGTSLTLSHMLRACIDVLCNAERELLDEAASFPRFARPANGDPVLLAQYEQRLATIISRALQGAPAVRGTASISSDSK